MRKEPDGYYNKFKKLSGSENWKDDTTGWTGTINNLTTELRNLDLDRLQKEKLEAQANLRYSEIRNENVILKYGLPIASFFSSTAALLISLFEDNAVTNAKSIALVLSSFFIAVAILYIIGEWCRNSRVKEIIYYQTKLKIIEIVEDEKKSNSDKRVATGNKKCYMVEVEEKNSDF